MSNIGIIGGSGVYNIDGIKILAEHEVFTPFGQPSDKIIEAELAGTHFFFIPRHGRAHSILPSEVNYRANIYALKKLDVKYIISVSAVGSLKEELPPGTFVLPDQFIDWTKGKRERSFFGNGIVGHVSTALPVDCNLQKMIAASCEKTEVRFSLGGSYLCIEGPQFSTKAESAIFRSFGASVIGMTNVPEAYLAKEAAIAYSTIAMVTDFDCWKDEHCSVEEIIKVMGENNKKAQKVLLDLLPHLSKNKFAVNAENKNAVMTAQESMSDQQKEMIKVLLR